MLNSKPLKLNSYKIDTQSLQSSIRDLNDMKQQLQTTISFYRESQSQLLEQNERLKQQIQMLQQKKTVKIDHQQCQMKILQLEAELRDTKKEAAKLKIVIDNEKRNQEVLNNEIQKIICQNKATTEKYQQKNSKLTVELKQAQNAALKTHNLLQNLKNQQSMQSVKIKKSEYYSSDKEQNVQNMNQSQMSQNSVARDYNPPVQSIKKVAEQVKTFKKQANNQLPSYHTDRSLNYAQKIQKPNLLTQQKIQVQRSPIKQLQKNSSAESYSGQLTYSKSQTSQSEKQVKQKSTSAKKNAQSQKEISRNMTINEAKGSISATHIAYESDQQAFSASIRKAYQEVKELGLSAKQMQVLPQFKKMRQNNNPSSEYVANFLKGPPFQQSNQKVIAQSAKYLLQTVKQKHGTSSGKYIAQLIMEQVEDYENSSKLKTEDLQISQMTPSMSRGQSSSYEVMSEKDKRNQGYNHYSYNSPSIQDNVKFQSQGSLF